MHQHTCIFKPVNSKGGILKVKQERAGIGKQVAKTMMTLEQRKNALDSLSSLANFALVVPSFTASSSSSSGVSEEGLRSSAAKGSQLLWC